MSRKTFGLLFITLIVVVSFLFVTERNFSANKKTELISVERVECQFHPSSTYTILMPMSTGKTVIMIPTVQARSAYHTCRVSYTTQDGIGYNVIADFRNEVHVGDTLKHISKRDDIELERP